jgi:hypothetical protein
MEKVYWLGRKRASLKLAQRASSAEARSIHYDLAHRYSVKANSVETADEDLESALPAAIHAESLKVAPEDAGK